MMEPATTTMGLNAKLVITTPRGLETLETMGVASEFDKSNAVRPHRRPSVAVYYPQRGKLLSSHALRRRNRLAFSELY